MSTAANRTRFTYEEYCLFPDDGHRHEVIGGEHYMNPAPNLYHQTLSRRLQFQLYTQIELEDRGEVFDAPVDVELGTYDIVQPDLVVVLKAQSQIQMPSRICGAPDLVVEILSPSTARTDRELKLELYRSSGVPEYWIVDPEKKVVLQYLLEQGRYRLAGEHNESFAAATIAGVHIDLMRVW